MLSPGLLELVNVASAGMELETNPFAPTEMASPECKEGIAAAEYGVTDCGVSTLQHRYCSGISCLSKGSQPFVEQPHPYLQHHLHV